MVLLIMKTSVVLACKLLTACELIQNNKKKKSAFESLMGIVLWWCIIVF